MDLPIEWMPSQGRPEQLILLHGWGEDAQALTPLAQALRAQFAQAAILAPNAPHAFGRARAAARPPTAAALDALPLPSRQPRIGASGTALPTWTPTTGRSMSTPCCPHWRTGSSRSKSAWAWARQRRRWAGSRKGRFCLWPWLCSATLTTLAALQGDATLDVAEQVGHVLHPALIDCALHRLSHHIPRRTWRAALGAAPDQASPPSSPARFMAP